MNTTKPYATDLVDLSHTIISGEVTYKGLPAPIVCDYWSREHSKQFYAEGTTFQIGKIEMVANTGTYLDTPFHRYEDGKDLSEVDLSDLAGLPAVVVRIGEDVTCIDASYFKDIDVRGKAVLVHTNWSRHWGMDQYFEDFPYLNAEAAEYLRNAGAKLVGIDSFNIDDTSGGERPVHSILLRSEVLIVEHLTNLGALPEMGFLFYAVPVKVKDMGTFPVRAFAALSQV